MSTLAGRKIHWEDEEGSSPEKDSSSTLPLPLTPEKESFKQNISLKQLMDTKIITLGVRYFPRANDDKFGI